MTEQEARRSSISQSATLEEMGEFWDAHDLSEFEALCPDVTDEFEVSIEGVQHLIAIDPDLLQDAVVAAHERGISVETLVNLAIRQAVGARS